jgi:hypothetical protein
MYDAMLARGYRIEAEAAALASPDVLEALEAAEFALNITVAAESDDRSWYDEACEALETVRAALAALPAAPAGLDVWAVVVGNYFPREVEAIYLHEADAVRHADEHDGRDVVKWTVAAAYAEGEPGHD